jgi:hypothetical protein
MNFNPDNEIEHVVSDAADRVKVQVSQPTPALPAAQKNPKAVAATDDPFAPRGWQSTPIPAPLAPVAAPQPIVSAPPPAPVAAPAAPSLPYAFMGQFDDGGRQVVYLSRNDQTFVITPGETLEGTYKVLAMNSSQIEFEHMPTGTKQVLAIPAPNN